MPLYLNTRGNIPTAIGTCDRCHAKRPLTVLVSDPNAPGLRVCGTPQHGKRQCVDILDPYRLPPRRPERIVLNFPRPDVPLDGE